MEPIMYLIPKGINIKYILTKGVYYPVADISKYYRLKDLKSLIKRGNHQSSIPWENKESLIQVLKKYMSHGWEINIYPYLLTDM